MLGYFIHVSELIIILEHILKCLSMFADSDQVLRSYAASLKIESVTHKKREVLVFNFSVLF